MIHFHHHPDGLIYIRGDDAIYMDTPENFAGDYGKPAPALPAGMVECIYEPAGRHVYFDAKQNAHPVEGIADSVEHEAICAALEDLLAAQSQRIAAKRAAAALAVVSNASVAGTIQL